MQFIDTYQQLKHYKKPTLRDLGRRLALDMLAAGYRILHHRDESFSRPRIQFLYIHHVFSDEAGKLKALLQALSRHHTFISYTEAVERIANGTVDKAYISISSDDGLKNNMRAAAVLNEFGAGSCFFICPSMIGQTNPEKIGQFCSERLHFPPVEFMTWEDVHTLQKQGHEIGGHTLSHVNIAATPAAQLQEEIAGCYEIIGSRCGGPIHFAYPYGRFSNFTEYGRTLVLNSGYSSCASAQRACHITERGRGTAPADLLIRRDHVILDWPLAHILYFIARNSDVASINNNSYPPLCVS